MPFVQTIILHANFEGLLEPNIIGYMRIEVGTETSFKLA